MSEAYFYAASARAFRRSSVNRMFSALAASRSSTPVSVLANIFNRPGRLSQVDSATRQQALLEGFVAATRSRQLPPEVWAVHAEPGNREARHYYQDPRVNYRVIFAAPATWEDSSRATRAAARVKNPRRSEPEEVACVMRMAQGGRECGAGSKPVSTPG